MPLSQSPTDPAQTESMLDQDRLAPYRAARSEAARLRQEEHDALYPPPTSQQIKAWRGDHGSWLQKTGDGWLFVCPPGYDHLGGKQREWSDWQYRSILGDAARLDAKVFPKGYMCEFNRALALRRIVRTGWNSAKKRAAKYGLEFDITPGDADRLLWTQATACAVSGVEFRADTAGADGYRAPFRPSLDRISSTKGYVPGNVRLVLTLVNLAMNDWGDEPLIAVARAIAAKYPEKRR